MQNVIALITAINKILVDQCYNTNFRIVNIKEEDDYYHIRYQDLDMGIEDVDEIKIKHVLDGDEDDLVQEVKNHFIKEEKLHFFTPSFIQKFVMNHYEEEEESDEEEEDSDEESITPFDDSERSECPICLEEYKNDFCIGYYCSHRYCCQSCSTTSKIESCPLCRSPVEKVEKKEPIEQTIYQRSVELDYIIELTREGDSNTLYEMLEDEGVENMIYEAFDTDGISHTCSSMGYAYENGVHYLRV